MAEKECGTLLKGLGSMSQVCIKYLSGQKVRHRVLFMFVFSELSAVTNDDN